MAKQVNIDPAVEARRQYFTVLREVKRRESRDSLEAFIRFTMPDKDEPDNPDKSRYMVGDHHRLLIKYVERVVFTCEGSFQEKGLEPLFRFANSIPPQHGKSEIISRRAVAWAIGRNPHWNIIVGTYSIGLARKIGSYVRDIMRTPDFQSVFPECKLKQGSEAKEEMETTEGGSLTFAGRKTATTGLPCDLFVIDDPYKNLGEAKSDAVREEVWDWFTAVVNSRTHNLTGIMMIHTRWVENDLIGLLADQSHPSAQEDESEMRRRKRWTYINVPAILDEDAAQLLGKEVGTALWPQRHNLAKLEAARELDPVTFSAMHMGRPSPDDGTIFTRDMIRTYSSHQDRPKDEEMTFYLAGDLAVSTGRRADFSALVVAGIDSRGNLWIVDAFHGKLSSDKMVEKILDMMIKWQPAKSAFERGAIQKTIGPFLRRRMRERETWHSIMEMSSAGGKEARSISIQAMMGSGRVYFPDFLPFWAKALDEMLKFPVGAHDDFVDAISYLGLMIAQMYAPNESDEQTDKGPKEGTLAWLRKFIGIDEEKKTPFSHGY